MRSFARIASCTALLTLCALPAQGATVFSFSNFASCTGLQLNGNAACTSNVLRLTPATGGQSGSTFSTTQIALGSGASFSTFFSFQMTNTGGISDGDGVGADGIVFVVQPVSSSVGGGGGGIGYQGITPSVGVEFDTYDNGVGAGDPNGNHVGIDTNGSVNSLQTALIPARMNNGSVWYAWIDYDGTTLELRLSQTNSRPATATLSRAMNLATILGTTSAFVGFTAGSGAAWENQDILSWQFDNSYAPIGVVSTTPVPTLSAAGLLLLAGLFSGAAWLTLRRRGA